MEPLLFGITAGDQIAAEKAARFGVDFLDLHVRGDEARLIQAMQDCDRQGKAYLLNFEGAPLGWSQSESLRGQLAERQGFLGFLMDEADHMQINAHWPVIDYYGYEDRHYLVKTQRLDLFAARQAVFLPTPPHHDLDGSDDPGREQPRHSGSGDLFLRHDPDRTDERTFSSDPILSFLSPPVTNRGA